jgi:glycosyltransferase involved in cell wall biosynthesis
MSRRILFIDEDQERNGATVSLEYLVRGFAAAGYETIVLTWKQKEWAKAGLRDSARLIDGRWGPITTLAMSFHFTYTASPLSLAGIRNILKDAVKFVFGFFIVRRVIRRTDPDLVYVNEYSVVQAALAARTCGIPTAMHIRSRMLSGGIRRWAMSRLILRCVDAVFAITRIEAEQLRPRPREEKKIFVVGEFVPVGQVKEIGRQEARAAFGLPDDRKVIVMMGGIREIKGARDFLRAGAVALERYPRAILALAGGTKGARSPGILAYEDSCMEVVRSLQRNDGIRVLGEIPNPLDLIAASDILVSPSTQGHFSRPVIEAWGFGKPVVVYRTPHMERLIAHESDGLLLEPGDIEGLAAAMIRLLEDPAMCQRLGAAGRSKVNAEFDATKNLTFIVNTCTSLMTAS